ncbi:hypothetical protein F4781DRAFT_418878 [Annulohypoxylon bovei var. microspora]|nr:hypothetical protein F4781DRAFT_418878 [Annulohypoxylon bovei var. microspora]
MSEVSRPPKLLRLTSAASPPPSTRLPHLYNFNGPPPPTDKPLPCADCGKVGHHLCVCTGPVDGDGFIADCPIHNTTQHSFDQCAMGRDDVGRRNFNQAHGGVSAVARV